MKKLGLSWLKGMRKQDGSPDRDRVVLVTAVRDEAPYLLEWLAHYRGLGVDRIEVYHNHCSDQTAALLSTLETGCDWLGAHESAIRDGQRPQMVAQRHALAGASWRPNDWMLHVDCDEFLVLHRNSSLRELLLAQQSDVGRVVFNWRVFGSNGERDYRPEPVTRRFLSACVNPGQRQSRVAKCAFRPVAIDGPGIHRPELQPGWRTAYADGSPAAFVDDGAVEQARTDTAQLNHYIIRSRAEFCHKQTRGAGGGRWCSEQGQPVTRGNYDWRYFERIDATCSGVDDSVRRHDASSATVLRDLLAQRAVAELHRQAVDDAAERMSRLLIALDKQAGNQQH